MVRHFIRPRRYAIPRLVALVGLLAMVRPEALRAQEDDTFTAAQRAEIRAVPLTMDLSRRAYGVTMDMMALVKADPKLRNAFIATMGASLDETVKMLDAHPGMVGLVHAARFASVRDYEIANMAFVSAYSARKVSSSEQLDPQHLTSPAQVAFIRSHQAELTKLMATMPLLVPHTTAPD